MLKPTPAMLAIPVTDRDHMRGPAEAVVTLVEYGDYECPHCGRAQSIIDGLLHTFAGKLRLVYRHFPLVKVHPHARLAAELAESAAAAGKFWEMHDLLYHNQDKLEMEQLLQHAAQLGLNVEQVRADLTAHTYAQRVTDDLAGGLRSGATGTPTIFVNDKRHVGYDRDSLMAAITAAIG